LRQQRDGVYRIASGSRIRLLLTPEPANAFACAKNARNSASTLARSNVVGASVLISGARGREFEGVFQTDYQQVHFATHSDLDCRSQIVRGWPFKKADRWGFLDLDGRVVLDADFDQSLQPCDGPLLAYKSKECLYFKADGTPLRRPGGCYLSGACGDSSPHTLKIGDKLGLVTADWTPLTPVRFEAITWAGQHARNAKIGGKWGRSALDGRWLIEPNFD
jgi:hypothetical protein